MMIIQVFRQIEYPLSAIRELKFELKIFQIINLKQINQ